MEGVAGIVDWNQCRIGAPGYAQGCELLQGEVNAVIEGALAGGATDVVVNDSHGRMANLDPVRLSGQARYLSGGHKPMYMMQGLDDTFAAVFLVGYHGSISGAPSALSHSYNPDVFTRLSVNGREVGEGGVNALVAQHYEVPIAFVSGDSVTVDETAPFAPGAVTVVTKESITRGAALSLHPSQARELLRAGAEKAVRQVTAARVGLPGIAEPAFLDMEFATSDMAELATWVRDTARTGQRSARIEGSDLLSAYRAFVAVTYITRQAGGR
jgi:D-amino peptidase